MKPFLVHIRVSALEELRDPHGAVVAQELQNLQFPVQSVSVGKFFAINLSAKNPEHAKTIAENICRDILANPVTETFHIHVQSQASAHSPNPK